MRGRECLPCEQYSVDSLRLIGNVDLPPRPPRCLLLTERISAPVSLPAFFFSWPNRRSTDHQTEGRALRGLAPFVVARLLPFLFPFGCGTLWTVAALRRFLLALAGFVAVSSALTGALHVRLLTNHRATVLLRRCTGNKTCLPLNANLIAGLAGRCCASARLA